MNKCLIPLLPALALAALVSACGSSGDGLQMAGSGSSSSGGGSTGSSGAGSTSGGGSTGGGSSSGGSGSGSSSGSTGSSTSSGGMAVRTCISNAANYNEMVGDGADKLTKGQFSFPFCEEKFLSDYPDAEIADRGAGTGGMTNPAAQPYSGLEHCKRRSENKVYECKPTAGSIALLPDGRMVYFNALEGTENVEFNIVKEFGDVSVNDQTRVLKLGSDNVASWTRPINVDGGAVNPTNDSAPGGPGDPTAGTSPNDSFRNDGALFCAHLVNLYDGRVMAAGGTDYYTEAGAVELEGLRNTRIFNPANDTWSQADLMTWGRWYPTLVTFANGNVFVASGVRKLLKPVYADRPADESGRNETHTEIFQPGCNDGKGKWTDQGALDSSITGTGPRRSLPLFARLHLLPNDEILYAAGGQAFNPAGQSYDMALTWDMMAVFNATQKSWRVIGMPGAPPFMGFRGSTSNVMLPLVPEADGSYKKVELLTMGGTYGLSPGGPAPIADSRIDTITLNNLGFAANVVTRATGAITKARWYGQGVLMPDGQVMLFSGADLDEVISPGSGTPMMQPELWNPATNTWTAMATQGKARTYHNIAFLMPDGRIMVGGHGPISNNYSLNAELPGKSPQGRDPSFEIYSPPYIFKTRPATPTVKASVAPGELVTVTTPDAANIAGSGGYVVLVRRTALTHLVDGDQRNVVLKIEGSSASSLSVRMPNNKAADLQAVVPPGHYMLFVVKKDGNSFVPSVSAPVQVTGADLTCR